MRITIVRPGDPPPTEPVDVCIVVDVLRATTTASVLCHRLGELCVLRTPADLEHLPSAPAGYALFSELTGVVTDLPRYDNSPVQAREVDLRGRTPVLVTTNGTLAVGLAAQFAREVVLASFVNLSPVVAYVQQRAEHVAIMPAGNISRAQRCIEDDGCADALASRLAAQAFDVAAAIAACRTDERIVRRQSKEPGLAADLDMCFSVDAVPIVPRVAATDQRWYRVTRSS